MSRGPNGERLGDELEPKKEGPPPISEGLLILIIGMLFGAVVGFGLAAVIWSI